MMKTAEELRKESVYLKPSEKSMEYLLKLIESQIERINLLPTREKYIGLNPENMTEIISEGEKLYFTTQESLIYDNYLNAVKREEEPSMAKIRKYFDDLGFKTEFINTCSKIWDNNSIHADSMLKISW